MKLNDTAANDATMTKLREAAQTEAERRWPGVGHWQRTDHASRLAYVEGQLDLASRLTREKIRRSLIHMGGDWRELSSAEIAEHIESTLIALMIGDEE